VLDGVGEFVGAGVKDGVDEGVGVELDKDVCVGVSDTSADALERSVL
jgi:hypothetical protein